MRIDWGISILREPWKLRYDLSSKMKTKKKKKVNYLFNSSVYFFTPTTRGSFWSSAPQGAVTNLLPSEWHQIYGVSRVSRTLMGETQAMRPHGQDSISYYQQTEERKTPPPPPQWSLPRTSYAVTPNSNCICVSIKAVLLHPFNTQNLWKPPKEANVRPPRLKTRGNRGISHLFSTHPPCFLWLTLHNRTTVELREKGQDRKKRKKQNKNKQLLASLWWGCLVLTSCPYIWSAYTSLRSPSPPIWPLAVQCRGPGIYWQEKYRLPLPHHQQELKHWNLNFTSHNSDSNSLGGGEEGQLECKWSEGVTEDTGD